MKCGKLICALLAVLLLGMCVCSVSAATVSTVNIDLDAPSTGITKEDATSSSGVTLSTSWSPSVSSTFDAETTYTATITITPKSGNTFADSVTVKLNGDTKTVTKSDDGKTLTISHTFSKTASATTTNSIDLKVPVPKYTNAPAAAKDITISSPSKGLKVTKVTWDPDVKTFELGKEYTVKIEVESTNSKLYPISTSATAWINNVKATISDVTSSKATITYTFSRAEPLGTISDMNVGVTAPVVGKSPSSSVTTNSNMFTASASWSPSETFHADESYTVTVTVNAKKGFLMDSSVSAKVNGVNAYVERISDTQAKITYTFGQIASIDSVTIEFAEPASGEVAQTKATSIKASAGTTNSATIKWTPQLTAAGEFDSGVEYTAEVTFSVAGNVVFDQDTIVRFNGERATIKSMSSDYKTVTATYTYPKTFFIPNPIEVIKEFFKLMQAMVNPASYTFL